MTAMVALMASRGRVLGVRLYGVEAELVAYPEGRGEVGGAGARRARSPPFVEDEDDRGGGGLGRLLAGPACCGWAAQGKPQVSPSFFNFCFSIFFLTFV